MSVQKTTVTIPAKREEQVTSVTCDLCGEVYPSGRVGYSDVSWSRDCDDIRETAVMIVDGHSYGDFGGDKVKRSYHICMECFANKLEPWLNEQGARPTIEETDW